MYVEVVSTVTEVRRTQHERTEATRTALTAAARRLFGAEGYAAVGTERIAREAGVTRGALYHQYADKSDLFAAVLEKVEAEIVERMARAAAAAEPSDSAALLLAGADAFLDACAEPELGRIVLIDGPSVLGWQRWRGICLRYSVGLVASLLAEGMERGTIARQPVDALTHVLVGAVDEAALYVALADDRAQARADTRAVLRRVAAAIVDPSPGPAKRYRS
jgi:AcrR family transcriptional regulator